MKAFALLALLVASTSALQLRHKDTPVSKVIQMLEGMAAQGKKEKELETATFDRFSAFCHDTTMEKTWAIGDENDQIEQLTADIQKYESDIARLSEEIEDHDADIATWEGDKTAAAHVRKSEHKDYEDTHRDYSESIDALERAISTLKGQSYDRRQALVQLQSMKLIPSHAKRIIAAFLGTDENVKGFEDFRAPEANGYEFQSGGVVEMLEKLLTKFEDERATLEREESNARHAHDMLSQDLANQISTATEARNTKAEQKSSTEQANADAKVSLEETTAARDSDQRYLDETTSMCSQKAAAYEARQQLRTEELQAIAKAIEIISSQVSGLAEKHLPTLAQTSLVQLRSSSFIKRELVTFLLQQAKKINSRVLFQLAAKAEDDPFKKIKAMIQDLITRLMEEANEEAEHKGWCDTELATNEQTRKQKTAEIDDLTAQIDKLTADIAQLSQEIVDLNDDLAALEKAMSEATENRNDEHAKNTETIRDAKDAQAASAQALAVLNDYYAKAAESTALAQEKRPSDEVLRVHDDAPDSWNEAYHGMTGEGGGVVGMLEVIQSDFARLEADTKEAEATAADQYEKFMHASEVDRTAKTKDVEFKTEKKNTASTTLATAESDRQGAQKELDAALAYYEKLKPSCVDSGVSYEDRVNRRKEEIESLQEALRILSGEDIAA